MHVIPIVSGHYWYMPLQTSFGNPSLNLRIWNAFSEATGSSLINLLRAIKGWMLSTAFFSFGSEARSTLPKSCLTTHRIRCSDKKQLLQYGSGLDRRRGKNPSEIFTPLTLINNLLCLQQDQGFVQISTYFITSETARVPFMQLTQIQGWSFLT